MKLLLEKLSTVHLAACVLLASSSAFSAPPGERISTSAEREDLAVTIYSDNLALIRETRHVPLAAGANSLAWREVSAQIRPETAQLRNLSQASGFELREQHFDFDLLTPASLLERNIGKEVIVIRTHPTTGADSRETARVLATNGGTVLQFADRIEIGPFGRLAFPALPQDLRDKPTLVMSLRNPVAGDQKLELSYLSGGLSWRADYVAELNAEDDRLDLNGWVTLTNQSGASYPEAKLQLVAGDVNRVHEPAQQRGGMALEAKMADMSQFTQASLLDYHLYTLQRPTDLADKQTKQVALLAASGVPVVKTYLLQGAPDYYSGAYGEPGQKSKVGVFIAFRNSKPALGIPLPGGVLRVYKKDRQGHAQFVGEARIDHTPANETVRMKLGEAFDVTAGRKQTDFRKLAGDERDTTQIETAYQIELKNAGKKAVTVTVREPIPGDWSMVSESQRHIKVAANSAEWSVKVPASGSTTLRYRVRVKY